MSVITIAGAAAVVASFFVLWWAVSGDRTPAVDLRGPSAQGVFDLRALTQQEKASTRALNPLLARCAARARRLLPPARIEALNAKILRAGAPKGWTLERLLGLKIVLGLSLGGLMATRCIAEPTASNVILAVIAAGLGFFLPDGLLDRKCEARQLAIRSQVSDTIDQLAVMVRAGLGIDAAIARVGRSDAGPLADELSRVMQDIRVGVARSAALTAMADRADVPELRSFAAALAQAEQLGVPIAQTLQLQADELREKRRQLAEEQAMKLPVKILFPMVLCILPVLFIVLLGPAAIRIVDQLGG